MVVLFAAALTAYAGPKDADVVERWSYEAFHHPAVRTGEVDWEHAFIEAWRAKDPKARLKSLNRRLPRRRGTLSTSHPWVSAERIPSWSFPDRDDAGDFPSPELRALAVARIYAAFRWTYPYYAGQEADWDEALPIALESVLEADTPAEYQRAISEFVTVFDDGHIGVEGPRSSRETPPRPYAIWSSVSGGPLVVRVDEPEKTPVRQGDRITHVDGDPWEMFANSFARGASGSNALGRAITRDQRALAGTTGPVRFTLDGPAGVREVEASTGSRSVWPRPTELGGEPFVVNGDIVVADLRNLRSTHLEALTNALVKADGLVVDLRNYPAFIHHGVMACLTRDSRAFATITRPKLDEPGHFDSEVLETGGGHCPGPVYDGPVVVLVDRVTYSRAEFFGLALRSLERAVFVGSTTGGTNGNRIGLRLPGRITVHFSGIGVFGPHGEPHHGVGITPDVEVHYTPEGVARGRDEVLERGLEVVRSRR